MHQREIIIVRIQVLRFDSGRFQLLRYCSESTPCTHNFVVNGAISVRLAESVEALPLVPTLP